MIDQRIMIFEDIHSKVMGMFLADMKSKRTYHNKSLANAFLNVYKIHLELADGTLALLKDPLVSHIPSGILLRSMFENYALFSDLGISDAKKTEKYVKKIEYFSDKTADEIDRKLKSSGHDNFANISRIDDKNILERVERLGENISMTYKMLSAYTHVAPFITKQLQGGDVRRSMGKYGHLSMLCVISESLFTQAMNYQIFDNRYELLRTEMRNLIDFPE